MAHALAVPQSLTRWAIALAVASAGGVLLGVLGPFGSYLNDGLLARIGYWVASMWSGLALYAAGIALSSKLSAANRRGFLPILVAMVLIVSMPQALMTRWLALRLWPELTSLGLTFASWYAQVLTIAFVSVFGTLSAMRFLRDRGVRAQMSPSPESGDKRSAALDGDVLALQMEDHYVRVHTRTGSELVLMPLGRAIEAVSSIEGLQTHRSWWVARHAVKHVEGSPRAMSLYLANGLIAPVSRSAVASLRAARWLESAANDRSV